MAKTNIISFLKVDNKGWDTAIFEDSKQLHLCTHCNAVCCDASELICDACDASDDDNDGQLYCNKCLQDLIKENNNKCPFNTTHLNPSINAVRFIRKAILKLNVFCPNFVEDNGCEWTGTLNDLLTTDHLKECIQKYNPSFNSANTFEPSTELQKQIQSKDETIKMLRNIATSFYEILYENEIVVGLPDNIKEMLGWDITKKDDDNKTQDDELNELDELLKTQDDELNALSLDELNELEKLEALNELEKCKLVHDDLKVSETNNNRRVSDGRQPIVNEENFDFKLCGPHINISICHTSLTNYNSTDPNAQSSVYGTKVISSTPNRSYQWQFIIKGPHTKGLYIGIDNAKALWTKTNFVKQKQKAAYAYYPSDGTVYLWNKRVVMSGFPKVISTKQNKFTNVLYMMLKFSGVFGSNGTLSFRINDGKEFVAVRKVTREKSLNYRLAVCAEGNGQNIIMDLEKFSVVS
eukprot:336334_1